MKKIRFFLIGFVLFVIVGLLLYVSYFKYHEYTSDKKIDDFIARIDKIPKKEILLVKDTYRQSTKQETNFSKKITTKKDFEKWKKEIKKNGKFYNGDRLPKNYLPKVEDCELIYNFVYRLPDKKVEFTYVITGTGYINSKKVIKENFAYPDIPFDYPEE